MGQSAKQSRDYFNKVKDLNLKNFPEEILPQYIFQNVLFIQYNILLGWMCSRDTRPCCRCTPGQPGCSQESVHGQDGDKELQDTQD